MFNHTGDRQRQQALRRAASSTGHVRDEVQLSKVLASEVSRRLLELSLSQDNFAASCDALFGEPFPCSELMFKSPMLTDKTTIIHAALPLEPMLACVELVLGNDCTRTHDITKMPQDAAENLEQDARRCREHRVKSFFGWLRNAKKVRRIVKLVVNDNPWYPCGNNIIQSCLSGFDIRYLDWDKQDLSIYALEQKGVSPNLQELWLSWSGRDSALFGWSNTEHGVGMLKKLRTLYVTPNSSWEHEETDEANFELFRSILRKHIPNLSVQDSTGSYTALDDTESRSEAQGAQKQGNDWLDAVAVFKKALRNKLSLQQRKSMNGVVKVAIIDDGVDLEDLDTTDYIVGGWHADRKAPDHRHMNAWYFSEEKHGTEMARLVQRVWPYTSLYIAKIETRRRVFQSVAESAAAAIDKAIENGANVISMSWTLYASQLGDNNDGLSRLKKAIERAGERDIIMFCASEDIGFINNPYKRPYPATDCDLRIMKRVGSAGAYGERSDYVNPKEVDYLFPGEIAMSQKEICSGSSAATALAAGLTALILWCAALQTSPATLTKARLANTKTKLVTTGYDLPLRGDPLNTGPNESMTIATPISDRAMELPVHPKRADTKLTDYSWMTNGNPQPEPEDLNFQSHQRMCGLFDALRSSKENPLVNISPLLRKAATSEDPALELVMLCKVKAHEFFEKGTMANTMRRR
ncbi:hypothetical protein VTJ83DRAFT_6980 [Remersonia thermophila]|uniref:Peptidase S8/S53 domain-containing protein n=1 Tax=Remersonia thermophila TaxID=72144 RepID=A0ABR4D6C6_9PEZI